MNTTTKVALIASITVVAACHGDVATNGASRETTSQRSALAAATTLAGALSGRIVEPATTLAGAATGASLSVGDDGMTNYQVPIWVPEGVNGLQPSLWVGYESGTRMGSLGPKWNLRGFSVIMRCPQTLAQDGIERPVSFTGDTFCLDGQRLRRQTGSANQVGEFRTEFNPFQKITVTATDGGGVATFQVYQPDGRIFYYGRTAASRLAFTFGPNTMTYAYYLDKIQDRFGNSILITYTSHSSQFTPPLSGTTLQALFPSKVEWGSTNDTAGLRKVTFQYQPASSYGPYAHQRRIGGNILVGGEHLDSMNVYGPDATSAQVLLKQYKLTYTTPSITGEKLLTTIQECDGASYCKRPTTMSWEPGSLAYTRTDLTTTQGITDIPMSNAPTTVNGGGFSLPLAQVYRRILTLDLNRDGRDDLVYRVWTNTCTSWFVRLATASGTFGAPIALSGAAEADRGCPGGAAAGTSTYYPYSGDILFSDLNQDGLPELIGAEGYNNLRTFNGISYLPSIPKLSGHYAYINNGGSPFAFSVQRIPLDVSGVTNAQWGLVSFGDVNGDGYTDVIRPTSNTGSMAVYWYSTRFPNIASNSVPGTGGPLIDVAAVDADGDNIAEIFRLNYNDEKVISPTFSLSGPNGPQTELLPMSGHTPDPANPFEITAQRWTADLNGDGLLDYASVATPMTPTQIYTGLATGARTQYAMPYSGTTTNLPSQFQLGSGWKDGLDDGVRVADYNLDGRDDLVLMGNGQASYGTVRFNTVVLLSNGAGGFTTLDTTIPLGDPSDGIRLASTPGKPYPIAGEHGYRTSAALDMNGDGLPDLVQLEGGHVISYVRQGKMPDMVTQIVEGTGHRWNITNAPLSDTSMYTVDSSCGDPSSHLGCLVKGRWLTKKVAETALERPNALLTTTVSYTYANGQYDVNAGRGFIGFRQRDTYGPGSRHTTINTGAGFRTLGSGYVYATAMLPTTIRKDAETSQGPNAHHYTTEATTYGSISTSGVGNTSITVLPSQIATSSYDCASNGAGSCLGASRMLGQTITAPTFDAYGNVTNRRVDSVNTAGTTTQTDTDVITYNAADTTNWLVRLLSKKVTTSTTPAETVTRTTKYVTSTTTGASISLEIEPSGDSPTHLLRQFGRDPRGRVTSVSESSFPSFASCSTSCSSSCTSSCTASCAGSGTCLAGCMASCTGGCNGSCQTTASEVRTTGYKYEDADGVYVTTTTNPLNQPSRQWRHPGWGYLVEEDDPNNLAEVWTYDTFGRMVSHTERTGSKQAYQYADTTDPGATDVGGVDYTLTPNDTATAAEKVHLDSVGREVFRTAPVDSTRVVTTWNDYDSFGRLHSRTILTGPPADPLATNQNSNTTTYDDLDRPIQECHLDASGTNRCSTVAFDGLKVTSTDESGHAIVRTMDNQLRPATEASSGVQLAAFGYGAFSLLKSETVSQTTVGYDVLGRQVSFLRAQPGVRKTTYNAYGEVASQYKQNSDGTPADLVTLRHDKLGRQTLITGDYLGSRSFYYDTSPLGSGGTNTIGKLIDAGDGITTVHFDYGANGLLMSKKSTFPLLGAPAKSWGAMTYSYDAYGRTSTVAYPQNLPGGSYGAFSVAYGYDPYVRDVSSVSSSGSTLWSVAARNALGEVTQENLKSVGGTTMTVASTYYLPTGQLNTRSLKGPTTQATETYTYQPNALPNTYQLSAPSGSYTETYGYDSLNRLSSWTGATGAPTVSYSYDWNGNLAQRSWSGETVTYANQTFPTQARVTTVVRNGVTVSTDKYIFDDWGRIYRSPANNLAFNPLDEVMAATDITNGNSSVTMIRDPLGERVATTYNRYPSTINSYLVTLGTDVYELKYNGATNTYEERCRIRANGRVVGDQVRTAYNAPSTSTYYLPNNVGSVIAEASDTGVVTARGQRDPYGNLIANGMTPNLPAEPVGANPDGTSRFGFAGHERDSGIALVDMLSRFYSPRLGQFVSPDSLITRKYEARDYFPYAYVWDNPVAAVDPSGHDLSAAEGYSGGWQGAQGAGADAAGAAAGQAQGEGARSMGGGGIMAGYAGGASGGGGAYSSMAGDDGFWGAAGFPCGAPPPFVPPASRPSGHGGSHGGGRGSTSQVMASGKGGANTQASTDSTNGTASQGYNTPAGDDSSADAVGLGGGPYCLAPQSEAPFNNNQKVYGLGIRASQGLGWFAGVSGTVFLAWQENGKTALLISSGGGPGLQVAVGPRTGSALEMMACDTKGGLGALRGHSFGGSFDTPIGSINSAQSSTSDCDFGGPGIGTGLGAGWNGGVTAVYPFSIPYEDSGRIARGIPW